MTDFVSTVRQSLINWPLSRGYFGSWDELVLRLLYNFLLLLFFNLKNPVKTPLILALSAYNSNTSSVTPIFYYEIVISMKRCNFLQSLKKIL